MSQTNSINNFSVYFSNLKVKCKQTDFLIAFIALEINFVLNLKTKPSTMRYW